MRLVRTVLSPSSRSRLVAAAVIPFVVAMGLAGCADPSASSGASGSASDAAAAKKAADADLEKSWAGTDRALPTSSPAVAKDKNVWIISCGQTAEGCAAGARGATEAGKKLGWKMTLVDGKFNVQTWNSGIRQAVADQADAVMLDIVDCGPVKGALAEAKKAGVKIYAWYSFDCDDGDSGAEPMFDAQVTYGGDYPTFVDWLYGYGGSMAEYIISETDGKAKVIQFTHEELRVVHYIEKGFEKRMKECDSCEVLAKQDITLADLGTTLQQKTATLLSRYPAGERCRGHVRLRHLARHRRRGHGLRSQRRPRRHRW
ncbi:MAG: substrate-binding domain-containing protein [Aeromicrobium erythreum]